MDNDFEEVLDDLSADAIAALLDESEMTDSARKELQRNGLFYACTTHKSALGWDVVKYIRGIENA